MRLEFSFTPTRRDLRWLVARASRRNRITLVVFGVVVAALGLVAFTAGESVGPLLLLYLAALFLLVALLSVRGAIARIPAVALLPRTYEIDDGGIRITTRVSVAWYAWEVLDRLVSGRGGWLIYAGRINAVAIPRSAVPAELRPEVERSLTRVGRPARAAQTAPPTGLRPAVPGSEGTSSE